MEPREGDGVDQQQRGVAGGVDGAADFVDAEVAPVLVSLWTTQTALMAWALSSRRRASIWRRRAAAPVGLDQVGDDAEAAGHFLPQMGEPAGFGTSARGRRGKGVGQRGFPGAGAGGGVDDDVGLRFEDVADLLQQLLKPLAEIGAAMVHGGVVHGAQDAVSTLVGPGICRK